VFPGVAGKLAPFYHLSHPTKGSVPGPWARLGSPGTRRLALDVARVWSEWDEDGKLGEAVGGAVRGIGQEEMEYWERRRGPG